MSTSYGRRPGPFQIAVVALLGGVLLTALGFVIGIIPGLLLGLLGLHQVGAIVLPALWAFGYVHQRARNYGDVGPITWGVAGFGALGLAISVWLLGSVTS